MATQLYQIFADNAIDGLIRMSAENLAMFAVSKKTPAQVTTVSNFNSIGIVEIDFPTIGLTVSIDANTPILINGSQYQGDNADNIIEQLSILFFNEGGGSGTTPNLQQAFNAAPTAYPQINAGANYFSIITSDSIRFETGNGFTIEAGTYTLTLVNNVFISSMNEFGTLFYKAVTLTAASLGNDITSNLVNFQAYGSTVNLQTASLYLEGNGGEAGAAFKIVNNNGSINLVSAFGFMYFQSNLPAQFQIFSPTGFNFQTQDTTQGFKIGGQQQQFLGNIFEVKGLIEATVTVIPIITVPADTKFVGILNEVPTVALDVTGDIKASLGVTEKTFTGIDLSDGQYGALVAGIYQIITGSLTNKFILPVSNTQDGKTISIILSNGEPVTPIGAGSGTLYNKSSVPMVTISPGTYQFKAIDADWYQF